MEEEKIPTMSPFCEAVMSATENLNELKDSRDCAMILCSDGDSLASRMAGNFNQMHNILLKKMLVDAKFAKVVSGAVSAYVFHVSEHNDLMALKDFGAMEIEIY